MKSTTSSFIQKVETLFSSGERTPLASEPESITAIIVAHNPMIRAASVLLLAQVKGVTVVGTASNGRDAVLIISHFRPRLAFIDIDLPKRDGIDVAAEIHRQYPDIGLIMLTPRLEQEVVIRSFKAGAKGYVHCGGPQAELELAVAAVVEGMTFISPSVSNDLLKHLLNEGVPGGWCEVEQLTQRQREVLQLIAGGGANKDIAAALGVSARTAENHRYRLMQRLRIHNAADLIRFAVAAGLAQDRQT